MLFRSYKNMLQIAHNTLTSSFSPGRKRAIEIAQKHGISFKSMISKNRNKYFVIARHEAMWEMHKMGISYPRIGIILGGRDHTTCMHGVRQHEKRLAAMKTSEAS